MILEARKRPAGPLAVEQDVADHPPLAGDRVQRQQPDARQLDAVTVAIEAAEELITAADGENDAAAGRRLAHCVALRSEVDGDESLLAILAAADVEQVEIPGAQVSPIDTGATSSSWPRHAARRASTAMLPRSA